MRRKWLWLTLLTLLLLSGCGGADSGGADSGGAAAAERTADDGVPAVAERAAAEDHGPYEAPDFLDAVFHADAAEVGGAVRLDLSALSQGYVAVSAVSDARLKFQVLKDDDTYNYDLASDGTPSVFPLSLGDGLYRFRVMENVGESKYAELYSATGDVVLEDEFQPFLRPSDYVSYTASSACVKKAEELAAGASNALDVVSAVYDFVVSAVDYDREKAASVQSGYLPDPDETLATGRGICFDYAALAAAMLRSQGVPTKVIFGYVSPDDLYHAWNMFYTDETGWVTVSYEVSRDTWNRLDLTFSAGGAGAGFVGDGGNYTDVYIY